MSFGMESPELRASDETIRVRPGSGWGAAALPPVRHTYTLVVRDASLATAFGLLARSLPYALARFAVLLATSVCVLVWLAIVLGGATWLGTHIASVFGWVWAIGWIAAGGFFWGTVVRYLLHLIECGHVAVLTELITRGAVANGEKSMFAYGKSVVLARLGQESLLFGLNALVRGVVESFHRTLDWVANMLPVPGLESMAGLINVVLKAVTRYLDKVIFSYTLARNEADPWRSSREGIVYYAQNARALLGTAVWSVVLERVLTVVLFLLLLAPAAAVTVMLPQAMRETGGLVTVAVALLLAGPLRAAFIKPLFLIMMIVRFHAVCEGQPIDAVQDARLSELSTKFRDFGAGAAQVMARPWFARGFT